MATRPPITYDDVLPYLQHIEHTIFQYLGKYAEFFGHVIRWDLSSELSAWTYYNDMSIEEAVASVLNYYQNIMLQYRLYCHHSSDWCCDDGDGHVDIYALMNNFETAVWENRLQQLLATKRYSFMLSQHGMTGTVNSIVCSRHQCDVTTIDTKLYDDVSSFSATTQDEDTMMYISDDVLQLMTDPIIDVSDAEIDKDMKMNADDICSGNCNDRETEQMLLSSFFEDNIATCTSELSICESDMLQSEKPEQKPKPKVKAKPQPKAASRKKKTTTRKPKKEKCTETTKAKKATTTRKRKKDNPTNDDSVCMQHGNVTKEHVQHAHSMSMECTSEDVDADVLSFQCAAKQKYFYMCWEITIEQTAMLANYIADHSKLVEMRKLSASAALTQFDDMLQHLAKDKKKKI